MPEQPRRRPTSTRRDLLRLNLRRSTPEQLADAVHALLDQAGASNDDRIDLLARSLVVEALRPYWTGGRSPQQAHEALRTADAELAAVIEAIAPMLLGRSEVRQTADEAIASIETLLGLD